VVDPLVAAPWPTGAFLVVEAALAGSLAAALRQ
jgi:hypothetical protein